MVYPKIPTKPEPNNSINNEQATKIQLPKPISVHDTLDFVGFRNQLICLTFV